MPVALMALVVALVFPGAARAKVPEALRLSALPDENAAELPRTHTPFAEYLARELRMPVRFTPVVDEAATVDGLAAGKLAPVWHGGFAPVQAVRRTGGTARRLALRPEDAVFRSVFVVLAGSGIRRLEDLTGQSLASGSVSSTAGHLAPRSFLLQARLRSERDFEHAAFAGAHDATALRVESGKVDAGALNVLAGAKPVRQTKVDSARVQASWATPPYGDYVRTVRGDRDGGPAERIAAALRTFDSAHPEHRRPLDLHRTRKDVRAHDADWKSIEAAAAGLLT